jgi:hypothetical protein
MVNHKKLVSVYLPDPVYQALIAYQEQQKLEEASLAIIEILEQFFQQGNESTRPSLTVQQSSITFVSTSLDEVDDEDEPDEILYDFLEPESTP